MIFPLNLNLQGNAALNPLKTFGVALDVLLQRNSENSEIPYVLERITEYIVCYGKSLKFYRQCKWVNLSQGISKLIP